MMRVCRSTAGERLVHQPQHRVVGEHSRERAALAHAARQLVRIAMLEPGQPDHRDELARAPVAVAGATPRAQGPNTTLPCTVRHGNNA
jgi:hypothetical protein